MSTADTTTSNAAEGVSPANRKFRVITAAETQKVLDFVKELKELSSTQEDDPDQRSALSQYWITTKAGVIKFVQGIDPMNRIITATERQYGSGVAVYYQFVKDIIVMNGLLLGLWIGAVMVRWFITGGGNKNYDAEIVVFNFLGLNGPRVTDGTWFYYSGYDNVMEGYQMGLAYAALIIATFGGSLLFIVYRIREALMNTSVNEVKEMYMLPCILYAWDWKLSDPDAATRRREGTILQMKDDIVQIQIRKEALGIVDIGDGTFFNATRKRQIRRGAGAFFSFAFVAASLVTMGYIVTSAQDINAQFSLLSAILLNIINGVIPTVLKAIVKFEQITDPSEEIRQEVLRIYGIKMGNIVFLMISASSTTVKKGGCIEFVVGALYIQLLVVDFVSNMVNVVITQYATFRAAKKKQTEFVVTQLVLDGYYRQCITWIGCCYSPMIFFYGSLCNFFVTWSRFHMMRVVNCPPSKPISKGGGAGLYRGLLLVTLIITLVPMFFFLQKPMFCGPHVNSTPMETIAKAFGEGGVRKALYYVFHPILLFIALVLILVAGYLAYLIAAAKNTSLENSNKVLQAEIHFLRELLKSKEVIAESHGERFAPSADTSDTTSSADSLRDVDLGIMT